MIGQCSKMLDFTKHLFRTDRAETLEGACILCCVSFITAILVSGKKLLVSFIRLKNATSFNRREKSREFSAQHDIDEASHI